MDFCLGLVLSLTDNATAGINNAVNSLNNLTEVAENASSSLNQMASLSAFSVVSGQLGDSLMSAGQGLLGTLQSVLTETQRIGSEFEGFDITLSSLFGGGAEGAMKSKEALNELFNFAKKSPLEVTDVKDMIVTLQSQGVNAFEKTKGAVSGTRQEFLAFLTDLKSFKPEVPMERFKMAIQNYIGSGEKKMMRTVFDMGDIEDIIGHGVSSTAEGRMNDIVEMVEKKGLTGLSVEMSETWQGVASNISDAFTQIYYAIADNGVFKKLKDSFIGVAEAIIYIDNDRLQNLGKTLAEGLNIVVKPIEKVAKIAGKLITALVNLCETNPRLVKFGIVLTAIAGSLLVVMGVLLKVASAFSGVSLMLLASGKTFDSIGGLFKSGISKILTTLAPIIAVVGLLYLAWKNDFAGVRTLTTDFVNNVFTSFNTARDAVNSSVSDMMAKVDELNRSDSFFGNLTVSLMKAMVLFRAVSEGWNDFTLSEDTFLKSKELGILPLVEAIFDLKYRFDAFKQGFIDGWKEISDNLKTAISGFLENIKGTDLEPMVNSLTNFLNKLSSGDTQAWYDFGKSFADFTAKAIAFFVSLKALDKVISTVSKIGIAISAVSKVGGGVAKVFGGIKSAFMTVFPWVSKFFGKIVEVIQLVAGGAGKLHEAMGAVFSKASGIGSVITGSFTAIASFLSMLKNGFSWVKEALMLLGIAIATIGAIILGVPATIAGVVAGIVALVATIVVVVKEHWQEICDFFSTIGEWINTNVIQPIAGFFTGLWNKVVGGVKTAFNTVKSFLSTVAGWIYSNVIQPVVNFFMTYIYPFIEKIVEIVAKIIEIVVTLVSVFVQWINTNVIQPIISFFQSLWDGIVNIFQDVVSWFSEKFQSAVEGIKSAFSSVGDFFSGVWNSITSVFSNVASWFGDKFSKAVEKVKSFFSPLAEFFQGVWDGIVKIFKDIGVAVSDAISGAVKGAINGILGGAAKIINGFIDAINGAVGAINKIPGVSISKITRLEVPKLATGGIVDSPTLSIIGEAGKEAVMPLENNTGWISSLATMLATQIAQPVITPVNTQQVTNTAGYTNNSSEYLTTNSTNTVTHEGDTDNSITFNEGSIQVYVQSATEEEARKLARKVMEYIKRYRELDRMTKFS